MCHVPLAIQCVYGCIDERGKVETFRINSGVRQWCVMSPRDWEEWEQDLQKKGDGGGG